MTNRVNSSILIKVSNWDLEILNRLSFKIVAGERIRLPTFSNDYENQR